MKNRLIPIAAVAALLLVGCDKSSTGVSKAVDEGRDSAAVSVEAARSDASKAKAAESKAEVLEQNSASEGSKTSPSRSEVITKTEAQAVDPLGEAALNDAITCLSRTIYWEAKGEAGVGMESIANVVMNRLGHEGFPDTICEVVMQGREQGSCQFSWWCDGRSDDAEEEKAYAIAKEIARKALNRQLADRTGGAMYFHHRQQSPDWSHEYIRTVTVGEHVFYKPHGGAAK
jgi:spore germination cell wall hydrolase CwlJ-like protein